MVVVEVQAALVAMQPLTCLAMVELVVNGQLVLLHIMLVVVVAEIFKIFLTQTLQVVLVAAEEVMAIVVQQIMARLTLVVAAVVAVTQAMLEMVVLESL